MRLFSVVLLGGAMALGLMVPIAIAASSMSMTAPPTATEGDFIDVHVSGSTDEPALRWKAFVQVAGCPSTVVAAEAQPGAVGQNDHAVQGGGITGPYAFDSGLTTRPGGQNLSGTVNVCSYLFRDAVGDRSTLATSTSSVLLIRPGVPAPRFGIRVPSRTHMSRTGTIRVFATCPSGCDVKVTYRGPRSSGPKTVRKHLSARNAEVGIRLPLDRSTRGFVKRNRARHGGEQVSVKATATPPSGAATTVTRSVKVT